MVLNGKLISYNPATAFYTINYNIDEKSENINCMPNEISESIMDY